MTRVIAGVSIAAAILLAASPITVRAITPDVGQVDAVTYAGYKVAPGEFNGDLSKLAPPPTTKAAHANPYRPLLRPPYSPKVPPPAAGSAVPSAIGAPLVPAPAPTQNFAGVSLNDSCTGSLCGSGWPPDPNGDVGPNHYIQAVNSAYGIFSKTGTRLAAFTEDQLWLNSTPPCNGQAQGDPIVVYDALADRWILSHFAFAIDAGGNPTTPFYQCIAVSKSGDPVADGWYLYPLRMDPGGIGAPPLGTLNDYTKFGIWNDCLYMSANEFHFPAGNYTGVVFASFSRADMYAGAPLTWSLGYLASQNVFSMMPSNASGRAAGAIPTGTPNYFVSESVSQFEFEVRKFTPGPNCGSGGTLSLPVLIAQSPYDPPISAPQPNTGNQLDTVGDRIMQKLQYRKIGSREALWVVHNVQAASGVLGLQWAQIDVSGGTIQPVAVQQGIYAPDTALSRWMGSLAVDGSGNMALGYSTSGSTAPDFPSIAYAGRLVGDPPNTLPQSETQLVAGLGSQTNTCGGAPCDRWGDYSAMSVDPLDDCTFWYTNEYYTSQSNGGVGVWSTRIGSFKFPSCVPVNGAGTVTIVANPYGAISVIGGTLNGSVISNLQVNAEIDLGPVAGAPGSLAQFDFAGLNIPAANTLTFRSGAQGQAVYARNTNAGGTVIGGTLQALGGNGAQPPVLHLQNQNGITVTAGGTINAISGLTVDALGSTWITGGNVVHAGTVDGGSDLRLYGANISGGGAFKGNNITIATFGNANNPVNGAHFLSNGLQLFPSAQNQVTLMLNDYGIVPQFLNVTINGNGRVMMPTVWPPGTPLPPNNLPVPFGGVRPPGVPEPPYGGGSMIVQATGSLIVLPGASSDFVFAGGIALKAVQALDLNGVLVNQGWTTTGRSFQGVFFESPFITNLLGNIQVLSNDLNWINFSTFPHAPVRTWTLVRLPNGAATYVPADTVAPHLNTYSVIIDAAANGQCWQCLVNPTPVNMF